MIPLLFTSPVTSIHAGTRDDRHCERERVHMAGVPERIRALKSLVVSKFKPWPPAWEAVLYPLHYAPRASDNKLHHSFKLKYCLKAFKTCRIFQRWQRRVIWSMGENMQMLCNSFSFIHSPSLEWATNEGVAPSYIYFSLIVPDLLLITGWPQMVSLGFLRLPSIGKAWA